MRNTISPVTRVAAPPANLAARSVGPSTLKEDARIQYHIGGAVPNWGSPLKRVVSQSPESLMSKAPAEYVPSSLPGMPPTQGWLRCSATPSTQRAARWNCGFFKKARQSASFIGLPGPPRSFTPGCGTDGPRLIQFELDSEAHLFDPAWPDAQMHQRDEVV